MGANGIGQSYCLRLNADVMKWGAEVLLAISRELGKSSEWLLTGKEVLYLPFSLSAFVGARRDGVPARAMVAAFVAGTFLMLAVVLGARSLNSSLTQ